MLATFGLVACATPEPREILRDTSWLPPTRLVIAPDGRSALHATPERVELLALLGDSAEPVVAFVASGASVVLDCAYTAEGPPVALLDAPVPPPRSDDFLVVSLPTGQPKVRLASSGSTRIGARLGPGARTMFTGSLRRNSGFFSTDLVTRERVRWDIMPDDVFGSELVATARGVVYRDVFRGTTLEWLDALRAPSPRLQESPPGTFFAAVSSDGKRALAAGLNDRFWLYDLDAGGLLSERVLHPRRLLCCRALGSSGVLIQGAFDGTVEAFDLASGREVLTVRAHDGPVAAVAVAPDGSFALSVADGERVKIWSLR